MGNIFKKGDVVVLKSGGPPITIDSVPGEKSLGGTSTRTDYLCKWFKGATACNGSFSEHLLKEFVPPAKK